MSQNIHNICGTEPASDALQVDHPEDVASIDLLQKLRQASEEKSTRAKVRREDVDLELLQKLRLASDTAAIETDPDALARRKSLRESFDGYDRNKDGYVTYDEVEWAWMNCCRTVRSDSDDGRAIAEATNFMRNMNKATDEKITFEEYVDFFEKLWARRKK